MSNSLRPHGLYSPWNSLDQNTGVGSLSLLQGIFPTQGLKPGLPHLRPILYQLSHKGSPKNTGRGLLFLFPGNLPNPGIEPTSLKSPALAGRFFTTSTTWEAFVCVCVCVSLSLSLHIYIYIYIYIYICTYPAYNYYQLSKIFSMIQVSLSQISPSLELEYIGLPHMSWYFSWMIFSVSQPLY